MTEEAVTFPSLDALVHSDNARFMNWTIRPSGAVRSRNASCDSTPRTAGRKSRVHSVRQSIGWCTASSLGKRTPGYPFSMVLKSADRGSDGALFSARVCVEPGAGVFRSLSHRRTRLARRLIPAKARNTRIITVPSSIVHREKPTTTCGQTQSARRTCSR